MMKEMDKEGVEKYEIIAVFNSGNKATLTDEQKKEITKQSTLCKMKKSN